MRIELLDKVTSTNEYIKRYLDGGENTVVCAARQSAGMGTKGRSFLSEAGGVYLTALIFPDLPVEQAFRIMAHSAVAVSKTISGFGIRPSIKWANDIFIGRKKCCGILIQNVLREGKIFASMIGIGLNVNNDVSALGGIACSMKEFSPAPLRVETVRDALIQNLCKESSFEEYLSFVGFLGKTVRVIGSETYLATAKRILSDGRLEVERNGEILRLSSGEISIRLEEDI